MALRRAHGTLSANPLRTNRQRMWLTSYAKPIKVPLPAIGWLVGADVLTAALTSQLIAGCVQVDWESATTVLLQACAEPLDNGM